MLADVLSAGPVPTIYGGGTLARGLAAALPRIGTGARAVSLHSTVPGTGSFAPGTPFADGTFPAAVASLRAARPGVRVWAGLGVDGVARRVRAGTWSRQQGVETFVGLARGAADQGADLVLWDGEPQYKGPDAATRDLLSGLVTEALEAVARRVPGLVQGHTSYGNVVRITLPSGEGWGGQGTYVWRAWIGPSSPVEVTFPQVYPAISHAIDPGVLQEYARRTRVSYAAAVEEGLVGRQVAQRPYLLLHGTPYADTVEVARAAGTSALWALPGTVDTEGLIALAHLTGEPPSEALDPSAGDFGVGKALAWGSLGVAVAAVARWWQGRTR